MSGSVFAAGRVFWRIGAAIGRIRGWSVREIIKNRRGNVPFVAGKNERDTAQTFIVCAAFGAKIDGNFDQWGNPDHWGGICVLS
jgi:hypothetical protein